MSETERTWSKPTVVTIARGTPAESVLSACKLFSPYGGSGHDADNSGCWVLTCNTACLPHSSTS